MQERVLGVQRARSGDLRVGGDWVQRWLEKAESGDFWFCVISWVVRFGLNFTWGAKERNV